MVFERQQRQPPRERTFAEVFPWRNIRRAVMLVLLIVAIVMIKRSTAPLLTRVTEMWGPPPTSSPRSAPPGAPGGPGQREGQRELRVRLGPGLTPTPPTAPAGDTRTR